MLKLLFDVNSAISLIVDIFIILAVVWVIIALIKHRQFKFFFFTVLIVIYCGITCLSIVNLTHYYGQKGGIIGAFIGYFDKNQVNVVEELTFSFDGVVLTKEDNRYVAKFENIESVMDIDSSSNYLLLINNTPCKIAEYSNDYVKAEYTYRFFDDDSDELLTDTLYLSFSFFKQRSIFEVYTVGNSQVVQLWSNYFNNNGFIVSIEKVDYSEDELLSTYYTVTFVYDYKIYDGRFYPEIVNYKVQPGFIFDSRYDLLTGSAFESVRNSSSFDYLGWSLDETTLIDISTVKVTQDMTFYALVDNSNRTITLQDDGVILGTLEFEFGSVLYNGDSLYANNYGSDPENYTYFWVNPVTGNPIFPTGGPTLSSYILTKDVVFELEYLLGGTVNPGTGSGGLA